MLLIRNIDKFKTKGNLRTAKEHKLPLKSAQAHSSETVKGHKLIVSETVRNVRTKKAQNKKYVPKQNVNKLRQA